MLPKFRLVLVLMLWSSLSFASVTMSGSFGYFSLDGKTAQNSTSVASPGKFSIGGQYLIYRELDVYFQYSILNQSFISGDRAYGPSVGIRYGYWGLNPLRRSQLSRFNIVERYNLLPYIKIGFAQRQFQSIRASYSGPEIGVGVSSASWWKIPLFVELSLASMQGGGTATASEMSLNAGVLYGF
jgi:hypothetical protein